MPTRETLERFVAMVEANAHVEAVEAFDAADSTMQENGAPPRRGRDAHADNERRVMARAKAVRSTCVRPAMVDGDHVALRARRRSGVHGLAHAPRNPVHVRWIFEFDWLDGTTTRMEEVAWQRWEGELIAEETFFYDPAQRVPRKPG